MTCDISFTLDKIDRRHRRQASTYGRLESRATIPITNKDVTSSISEDKVCQAVLLHILQEATHGKYF